MPRTIRIEGHTFRVPDDATPDEIEHIHTQSRINDVQSQPIPQAEDAPNSRSFLKGWGIDEDTVNKAQNASILDKVKQATVGPFQALKSMGSNLIDRVKGGAGEMSDAVENIAHGQPVMPNIGKAMYADENMMARSLPMVAPSAQEFGEKVATGEPGATGDAAAALSQGALGVDEAGKIAPEYGSKLISGEKTLPTVNPDLAGLAGGTAGYAAHSTTGLSPFYGYIAGKTAAKMANSLLGKPAVNQGVGRFLGGSEQPPTAIPTLSPLEAGRTSVPDTATPTPSAEAQVPSLLERIQSPLESEGVSRAPEPEGATPAGASVPPLQEETLPALDSPPLKGVPGRPPAQPEVVPPLADQMQSPLEQGKGTVQPTLLDQVQSQMPKRDLDESSPDVVPGNTDTDVTDLKAKYPHLFGEQPEESQTRDLYHGTTTGYLPNILKEGLKGAQRGDSSNAYLSQEPSVAESWAREPAYKDWHKEGIPTVLKFNVPESEFGPESDLHPEDVKSDKFIPQREGEYRTVTAPRVPPEYIDQEGSRVLSPRDDMREVREDQGILDKLRSGIEQPTNEPGTRTLYHGTDDSPDTIKSIAQGGLKSSTFASPSSRVASHYGQRIYKTDVPLSDAPLPTEEPEEVLRNIDYPADWQHQIGPIAPDKLSMAQRVGRPETVEDQGLHDQFQNSERTDANRLLKQQFEEAGQTGGHEARKGLYEAVTGLPASDFGEQPQSPLLRQVGGMADDVAAASGGKKEDDLESKLRQSLPGWFDFLNEVKTQKPEGWPDLKNPDDEKEFDQLMKDYADGKFNQ